MEENFLVKGTNPSERKDELVNGEMVFTTPHVLRQAPSTRACEREMVFTTPHVLRQAP